MICIGCDQTFPPDDKGFDYLTLFIGLATIVITIFVVYLGKRVEIKIIKFNKLCLEPLEAKFDSLEDIFKTNRNETIQTHLAQINEINTDLCIFLTEIQSIYPRLPIDQLQDFSLEFIDFVFQEQNQNQKIYTIQSEFLKAKIKILSTVYNHALKKELVKFW